VIPKSKEMLTIERAAGKPIDEVLIETFARAGSISDTAKALGIRPQTCARWIGWCSLRVVITQRLERTLLPPTDEVEVVRGTPPVVE
jgi:hypothetical protein